MSPSCYGIKRPLTHTHCQHAIHEWEAEIPVTLDPITANSSSTTSSQNSPEPSCIIRESVAQTIDSTQDMSFVLDTLYQLPDLPQGCILHSDQGRSRFCVHIICVSKISQRKRNYHKHVPQRHAH